MDLGRVGITGWSFGGYFTALALERMPAVFHAGVAGAPVTDWRDYDTHYTERYMGLPDRNTEGYEASSALTWAKDLSRPLLILHGTADDNVYFLHSLKLCDALMRAAEATARECGKTLLVLDTANDEAARLYERLGWTRVGVIPDYALLPQGGLCDTIVDYRNLGG